MGNRLRTGDRPLLDWLSVDRYYLKSPFHIAHEDYKLIRAWVFISLMVPLHEAGRVELLPVSRTWEKTLDYVDAACRKLGRSIPGWSPSKEVAEEILAALGPPPLRCYGLYLITVGDGSNERCVYVGQTNSKHQRFKAGHAALSKLHHTKYVSLSKRVYFAGLVAEDDDDHVFPLEWVHPKERRKRILSDVEGRLIFDLQPELNTKGRKTLMGSADLPISVQNITSRFLDAQTFGPNQLYEDRSHSEQD